MKASTTWVFLGIKAKGLAARARQLSALTPERVGIRAQDLPYAPSAAHFLAANRRLREIDGDISKRLGFLRQHWRTASPSLALLYVALVEREVDRARRAFGMFFEVFSQRGSTFAPALAAHDAIAADCYAAVRTAASPILRKGLLTPLTYMEHGYSPATMRRGITLSRLLGERNPFPLIRIPWDRDQPWQSVFLHEVAHNLQADLGIWEENERAVGNRMSHAVGDPAVVSVYRRWHKEIFADLAAVLLGGPGSAWGMMNFLAHPAPRTMTYKAGGAHPTGYLRVLILAEMVERLGFGADAALIRRIWTGLYRPAQGHRIPAALLRAPAKAIPAVVDEIAFQPRRNLAQRALADVIPFSSKDEQNIRQGSRTLAQGMLPQDLPPRFLVSAGMYALSRGADPARLSGLLTRHLSSLTNRRRVPIVIASAEAA